MTGFERHLRSVVAAIHRYRGLILPVIAAALIFAVLVPVPPKLMNVLLVGNITLAAIVLLTTIYVTSPLEFSVFPSLLLGATLIRLVLNVATTRLILTAGSDGRTMEQAQYAAGKVIWSFSHFVTAGSLEVGVILFIIISVIQFVVITKGAARISEVAARFVLDAMPGKQMSIDADLNAGLIDEAQAHRRREQIASEADFYGAMDGASKFLRGDAVAAVVITFVNILGGMYVGMIRYGWSFDQTLGLFTRLTIGDGLVTQIPAFIVAISAALIVTRSTARSNLGEEVIGQLTGRPIALVITAVFLAGLAFTSLPKIPLLLLGLGCAGLGWLLSKNRGFDPGGRGDAGTGSTRAASSSPRNLGSYESLLSVDPLRIEIGYALVPLVDPKQGGDLLGRIRALREAIASELGLLIPPVRIRDDINLDSQTYIVKVRGVKVGSARLYARKLLALGGEDVTGRIAGIPVTEPTFGTPGQWISRSQRAQAEMLAYTVVSPSAVMTTHLGELIRTHAAELLTRQQVVKLLDHAKRRSPDLVTEATEVLPTGKIQRILRNLLAEGVPIRDLETILETVCDSGGRTKQTDELTELVRRSLAPMLSQQYCSEDGRLWCVQLEPSLSEEIAAEGMDEHSSPSPGRSRRISEALKDGLGRLTRHGRRPVVVCHPDVRGRVRRIVAEVMPQAAVLAYDEVESADLESVGSIGMD